MIDHILQFETEAAAQSALAPIGLFAAGEWAGDCLAGVAVSVPTGTFTVATDDAPSTEIMAPLPGYWLIVAANTRLELPMCRAAIQRESRAVLYRDGLPPAVVLGLVFAGMSPYV